VSLYYAYIQSHFTYMSSVWSAVNHSTMLSLETLQRKSLRIVLKKSWFCSRDELYNIKFLPISVICKSNTCLQISKITSNALKNNVNISNVSDMHNYPTRSRLNFIIPFRRTDLCSQDFYIRGLRQFNELPQEIKNIFSINMLKRRLKEHFWNDFCELNK